MIEEPARSLAMDANFAAFTTLQRNGDPMTHVMWVDCDGEHLMINTETHRAKYRNVLRDPRVVVTVWDRNDPYTYGEVRGRVVETIGGEAARQHIDKLSMQYRGHPYPPTTVGERVILMVAPERQRFKRMGSEPPPPKKR